MDPRNLTYFVSDVHLGLDHKDPAARQQRFISFLRSIPAAQTETLYLLGDIFDFWYEYRYVIPKGYDEVLAEFRRLLREGVKIRFFRGNHDMWCFHYFADMGIEIMDQPAFVSIGGRRFCLGHGDGMGPGDYLYKLMHAVFASRVAQSLFSLLHPRVAFSFGLAWSRSSRLSRGTRYTFKGESERLYKYAESVLKEREVDYFIFGHYHCNVDMPVGDSGARLLMTEDWLDSSPYLYFNGIGVFGGNS